MGKPHTLSSGVDYLAPDEPIYEECKEISRNKQVRNIVHSIGGKPVGLSGDYRIKISLGYVDKGEARSCHQDLVVFRAISQEVILGWLIGMMIAISLLIIGIWNIILFTTQ